MYTCMHRSKRPHSFGPSGCFTQDILEAIRIFVEYGRIAKEIQYTLNPVRLKTEGILALALRYRLRPMGLIGVGRRHWHDQANRPALARPRQRLRFTLHLHQFAASARCPFLVPICCCCLHRWCRCWPRSGSQGSSESQGRRHLHPRRRLRCSSRSLLWCCRPRCCSRCSAN